MFNVTQIAEALQAAGFEVKANVSENSDIEDHDVEIVGTNFHVQVHPEGWYFNIVEETDSGEFSWHEAKTIEEVIVLLKSKEVKPRVNEPAYVAAVQAIAQQVVNMVLEDYPGDEEMHEDAADEYLSSAVDDIQEKIAKLLAT